MASIDNTFDRFMRLQHDALSARGNFQQLPATSSNILINLFKGYLAAPDKDLIMYI